MKVSTLIKKLEKAKQEDCTQIGCTKFESDISFYFEKNHKEKMNKMHFQMRGISFLVVFCKPQRDFVARVESISTQIGSEIRFFETFEEAKRYAIDKYFSCGGDLV